MSEELKVHAAAESWYCNVRAIVKHDEMHGPMVKAATALDAFKAGARWQSEEGSAVRAVPRMPSPHDELMELIKNLDDARFTNIQGLNHQAAQNYQNLMAMLEAINKEVVMLSHAHARHEGYNERRHEEISGGLVQAREDTARMFGTVLKTIDNNVSDQSGRHKAITGAIVETQNIIQDVGQKVEAVLDQVTVPEVTWRKEPNDTERLHDAMRSIGIDNPERFTVGWDLAKPGSDQTAVGMKTLTGWKQLVTPDWAGEIREIREFGGRLYVCCASAIFAVDGPRLVPLRFVDRT